MNSTSTGIVIGTKVYRNVSDSGYQGGERTIPGVVIGFDVKCPAGVRAQVQWEKSGNTASKKTWYAVNALTTQAPAARETVAKRPLEGRNNSRGAEAKYLKQIAEFAGQIAKAEKRMAKETTEAGRDYEAGEIARYRALIESRKSLIARL